MMRKASGWTYRVALLSVMLLAGLTASHAVAQSGRVIERIPAADTMLAGGLEAFEDGNWQLALDMFKGVESGFGRNAASSTARMMAAKSAFRLRDFEQTRSLLASFAIDFPGSSYANAARSLDRMAMDAQQQEPASVLQIGIMLSLAENARVPSQQLFNGIRMAVDAHNQDPRNRPARMVFRDILGGADAAAAAVTELADMDVDLIIGTLFSNEAVAAARQADEEEVVFIAPMATDERVSEGRTYSFQANPSMHARGRAMARFAMNGLRMDSLGVITVADDRGLGERLADGFVEGVSELGGAINLIKILESDADWFELPDTLSADTLDFVEAVYIPMASRNAAEAAGRILGTFDRFGNRDIRILGNAAWHDLPQRTHASNYTLTYANDFYPDLSSVEYLQFGWGYYDLSGEDVGRLGVAGYDVTRFALSALTRQDSRSLVDRIRNMTPFEGHGLRIAFNGGNVNEGLFFHRYRLGQLELVR